MTGLPDQLFYNTGISTYIWVLTNRKPKERKGRVQLVNATNLFVKMDRSLGNKRNKLSEDNVREIVRVYGEFKQATNCKIFDNDDFGYRRIVVERPLRLNFRATPERRERLNAQTAFQNLVRSKKKGTVAVKEMEMGRELQKAIVAALAEMDQDQVWESRKSFEKIVSEVLLPLGTIPANVRAAIVSALGERDETGDVCVDAKGRPEPDSELREFENVPLKEDIHVYFEREVRPHVPDGWIDDSKTKIGYEIPFTREFYHYQSPHSIAEIEAEIKGTELEIQRLLGELF